MEIPRFSRSASTNGMTCKLMASGIRLTGTPKPIQKICLTEDATLVAYHQNTSFPRRKIGEGLNEARVTESVESVKPNVFSAAVPAHTTELPHQRWQPAARPRTDSGTRRNNSCSLTFNACAKKTISESVTQRPAPRFWKWCFRQYPNRHAHNGPPTWPASSPCRNGFCARRDRQCFEERICPRFCIDGMRTRVSISSDFGRNNSSTSPHRPFAAPLATHNGKFFSVMTTKGRILVVDDEIAVGAMIVSLLTRGGCEAEAAPQCRTGLATGADAGLRPGYTRH